MGEDKPCRFVKRKQPFLVLQYQVVSRNIVRELAATLELAVHAAPGSLVDAEIALMYPMNIAAGGLQILLIRRIKQCNVLIQNGNILLFKHHAVFAKYLVAIFIVLAIFCHLVNEEQGQALDAHVKELLLFLEVGKDGLANLNAANILFGHIAYYVTGFDDYAVGKSHSATQRIDFGNGIAFVLPHFLRNEVKVVADTHSTKLTVN